MSIKIAGVEKMSKTQRLSYITMLLRGQLEVECDWIANLSNASAIIKAVVEDLNWAGFYLEKEGDLILGPFQGMPACNRIECGKGVCGTAMAGKETILVEDVEAFEGHIACDGASRSELVVPMMFHGKVIGVLDLDSPMPARFGTEERQGFEKFVAVLMEQYERMTGKE